MTTKTQQLVNRAFDPLPSLRMLAEEAAQARAAAKRAKMNAASQKLIVARQAAAEKRAAAKVAKAPAADERVGASRGPRVAQGATPFVVYREFDANPFIGDLEIDVAGQRVIRHTRGGGKVSPNR